MYHYFDSVRNTHGEVMSGFFVRCVDTTSGVGAALYADVSMTPIITVSGIADAAQVDTDGNVNFYVGSGTYHIDYYLSDGVSFVKRLENVPMWFDVGGAAFAPGNATAVVGSKARIDWVRNNATYPAENEAGIWSNSVHFNHALNYTFANGDGTSGGPVATLFAMANNNGSAADVVAVIGDAVARQANGTVFGGNFIARNDAGVNNAKLVGLEIDLEFAAGTTPRTGSAGLYINVFNVPVSGPAIQTGTLGGGSFGNGILLGGLSSTAAGLALTNTGTADSLVNTTVGTFTTAAIVMGTGATSGIKWTSGSRIYFDGINQRQVLPTGGIWAIRDSADGNSLITFDGTGSVILNTGGTVYFASSLSTTTATAGSQTLPTNPVGFLTVNIGGTNRKVPYYA